MVYVTLRSLNDHYYVLLSPSKIEICPRRKFRNDDEAFRWARAYVSSWKDWHLEMEKPNEPKSTLLTNPTQ